MYMCTNCLPQITRVVPIGSRSGIPNSNSPSRRPGCTYPSVWLPSNLGIELPIIARMNRAGLVTHLDRRMTCGDARSRFVPSEPNYCSLNTSSLVTFTWLVTVVAPNETLRSHMAQTGYSGHYSYVIKK